MAEPGLPLFESGQMVMYNELGVDQYGGGISLLYFGVADGEGNVALVAKLYPNTMTIGPVREFRNVSVEVSFETTKQNATTFQTTYHQHYEFLVRNWDGGLMQVSIEDWLSRVADEVGTLMPRDLIIEEVERQ